MFYLVCDQILVRVAAVSLSCVSFLLSPEELICVDAVVSVWLGTIIALATTYLGVWLPL